MNDIDWTLAVLDYINYVQSMSYSDKLVLLWAQLTKV
jgi:hypothetical protein